MDHRIIGDINEESFKEFDEALSEALDKGENHIDLILSSAGGSAYDALAFYDRIKSTGLNINIYVYGTVFSAAVLVLAAGDKRYMAKNAWCMVHEDTTEVTKYDKVADAEKRVAHGRKLEDQWNRLLSESTNTSSETWAKLHIEETYLTPIQCLELGLIDEVL